MLTPKEGCGLVTKVKNNRIIGGTEAPIGEQIKLFGILKKTCSHKLEIKHLKFGIQVRIRGSRCLATTEKTRLLLNAVKLSETYMHNFYARDILKNFVFITITQVDL